jgi:hypothetical protein
VTLDTATPASGFREAENYKLEGKGEREEKKAKRDLQDLIQKQFSLRRRSSCQENEETLAKYSRVHAAGSTGVKVNGLTVSVSMLILMVNLNLHILC